MNYAAVASRKIAALPPNGRRVFKFIAEYFKFMPPRLKIFLRVIQFFYGRETRVFFKWAAMLADDASTA